MKTNTSIPSQYLRTKASLISVKCFKTLIHRVSLTLCCSMASRARNSKGREWVCEASWGARSSTNQRSKPRPRKSNTIRDSGVTTAFRDLGWGQRWICWSWIKHSCIGLSLQICMWMGPAADSVNIWGEGSGRWKTAVMKSSRLKHTFVCF